MNCNGNGADRGRGAEPAAALSRWERAVLLHDASGGDTTKAAAARRLEDRGLISITDRWVMRPGTPGFSADPGYRRGGLVYAFTLTPAGEAARASLLPPVSE